MDKKIIKGNFSKHAASYEEHAAIQKSCAEELISMLGDGVFGDILEVGCGTGMYTRMLCDRYAGASITALDISEDMVRVARKKLEGERLKFEIADGENLAFDKKFDLITSNASFQWFEDIDRAFGLFRENLKPGGTLLFSMYGPETFQEFKAVLGYFFGARRWLSSSKFLLCREVEGILKKHFTECEVTEARFSADFLSIWDFLKNIKNTGTRGEGLGQGIFLGKYSLMELERKYIEKFGSITATHHVYFCRARM